MKILAIKRIVTKLGKPSILVQTATKDIFVTPGQWAAQGASQSLDNYVGGDIDANYFEEGEMLFDGTTPCTKSGVILKTVFVSANPAVLAHALAIESANVGQSFMDKAALYTRQRVEAKAKEAEAAKATKLA